MKKIALMMLFVLLTIVGCHSLDGTTTDDNEKVKENQVVDMSGK